MTKRSGLDFIGGSLSATSPAQAFQAGLIKNLAKINARRNNQTIDFKYITPSRNRLGKILQTNFLPIKEEVRGARVLLTEAAE